MTVRTILRLALATLILDLVLIQPNHPGAMTWGAFRLFPLELPVIVFGLIALPGRLRLLRAVLVAALVITAFLKIGDLGTYIALNRGFNPVVDWHLAVSGWNLVSGAIGGTLAGLAIAATLLCLCLLGAAVWWATGVWASVAAPRLWRGLAGVAAGLSAMLAVAEIGQAMMVWSLPFHPPGAAFTARVAVERISMTRQTFADLATFRLAAASDPADALPLPLARLKGRDVLIVFVESYARNSFDNPLYAPTHKAVLTGAEARLAAAGQGMVSGWITSPIEGGQSWLAHTTLMSGLKIGDQTRYDALIASPRRTLFQFAEAAGWRTAAISPAIAFDWPEGPRLGFATLIGRDAMGYKGLPFNWISMPDQYTLARFRDRLPADPRPLFAQITLISSHAPWVPVPKPVPWDAIGDGSIFDAAATTGERPEVVWQDPVRIRDQYRQSIAYSLTVLMDWAARQGPDGPLIVILGDHPPVAFVNQTGSHDVPMHLIGPPEVLRAVAGWGWTPGLIPASDAPEWPMETFRDRFLAAFSGP